MTPNMGFNILFFVLFTFIVKCVQSNDESLRHLSNVRSFVKDEDQASAVRDLINRVVGSISNNFEIDISSSLPGNDIAIISNLAPGKIKITATSGVAAAFGFNHYLKYYCNKQMSWAGDNLYLSSPLPPIDSDKLELDAGVKYRYYQNVCTVSYSFVWWNWTRWEREIDWMAMNAINLPLAFTGQEAIWRRVYKQLGCTDEDLDNFFTGPAFLAWNRMGNIYKWGGPLPVSWMDNQLALQHKILARMRSLGMIPVLPGFAGHIPEAITKLFKVNATRLTSWSHFNCSLSCSYLLEPTDPMFMKIGQMFIEEQVKEYNGTNHIYNCDTFNEMTPRSKDTTYLSKTSAAVFNAMMAGDDKAVWLMQGWLFLSPFWGPEQEKALLTAVPQGRMILLDLYSESVPEYQPTHSYYGQPFIWCMLHNFGGNTGFYGKIETINKGPSFAQTYTNSTMVGTGLTPEGINQNYIIYDLMLEVGYFITPRNLTEWVANFVKRRYGSDNADAQKSWALLASTVYNDTTAGRPVKRAERGPIVDRPNNELPIAPSWYDQSRLPGAWDYFMSALPNLPKIETVRYDAVDIARQILQFYHYDATHTLVSAFSRRDATMVDLSSVVVLEALDDMEEILLTDEHFLMGKWITDARNLGTSEAESDLYEYNARNQVTLWGPSGEIIDYASKEWASLVKHYYRPRWSLYIDYVNECMRTGKAFDRLKFNEDVFNSVEQPFTFNRTSYPRDAVGDTIAVAQKLYKKWRLRGFISKTPK